MSLYAIKDAKDNAFQDIHAKTVWFQHVIIPYSLKIMMSSPSRNISFSGYSKNCSVGARSIFLTQYMCFNSINTFCSKLNVCAAHTNTIPFRLSADPVVSTFAINDAIDNFLGYSCKNCLVPQCYSCLEIVIKLKSSLLKTILSSTKNVS